MVSDAEVKINFTEVEVNSAFIKIKSDDNYLIPRNEVRQLNRDANWLVMDKLDASNIFGIKNQTPLYEF